MTVEAEPALRWLDPDEITAVRDLYRQAATYGWRLAAASGPPQERVYRFERIDDDGVHKVFVHAGWVPVDGGNFAEEYRSLRVVSHASEGFLRIEHVGARQAVAILRAYFGWPDGDS